MGFSIIYHLVKHTWIENTTYFLKCVVLPTSTKIWWLSLFSRSPVFLIPLFLVNFHGTRCLWLPGKDGDGMEAVFYNFCGRDQADMDGTSFRRLCKDCEILDQQLDAVSVPRWIWPKNSLWCRSIVVSISSCLSIAVFAKWLCNLSYIVGFWWFKKWKPRSFCVFIFWFSNLVWTICFLNKNCAHFLTLYLGVNSLGSMLFWLEHVEATKTVLGPWLWHWRD